MTTQSIFELTGEVAIVTGGAAGIGKAIARRFAEAGAKVVVVDADPDTPAIVEEHLPGAAAIVADVALPHVHEDIVRQAAEPFGTPTILVNNAGIYPTVGMLEATAEFFDLVYNTNLRGVALMAIAFSRALTEAGIGGRIINMASIEGLKPSLPSGLLPYAATKGAVIAMTRNMAIELAPHGIAVNAIAPGTVLTEGVYRGVGLDEATVRELMAPLAAEIPIGRLGEPDDVAMVAVFLASPAAAYMRGHTIVVDGGWMLS